MGDDSRVFADGAAAPSLSDGEAPPVSRQGVLERVAFAIGCGGLMIATAADSIAVLGRHLGFPLLGSIEVVQAAIVLIAASSLVGVTLGRGHAAVHILTERLSPERQRRFGAWSALVAALTILLFALGSALLLGDLWDGHERSEILHIPLRLLRLLLLLSLLLVAGAFARQAAQGWRRRGA